MGSVKNNVGHTESASGVAGLIKVILMMQNGIIPKQANFSQLNPKIGPLEPDRMIIPRQNQPWTSSRRTAVVNNYGAAGNNTAIVVQDYQSKQTSTRGSSSEISASCQSHLPFFVSAKSPESLRDYCAALKLNLPKLTKDLDDSAHCHLAYNLSAKQSRKLEYSHEFTASSLSDVAQGLGRATTSTFSKRPSDAPPIVLCFGGQNGKTVTLNEELFRSSRVLQTHLVSHSTTASWFSKH